MSTIRVHHHGFTVSDVDRSVAFYRDVLGLEVIRVSERSGLPSYDHMLGFKDVHLRVCLLRDQHDNLLELFQYINPRGTVRPMQNFYVGSSHVAFQTEDVDALYEMLKRAGHQAITPPVDIVRDGRTVARGMYALDPDGISVEVFQEVADVVAQ
jgi:catechol 2,3-dioxygenase-like lactoylglutathione lyase family enzyme